MSDMLAAEVLDMQLHRLWPTASPAVSLTLWAVDWLIPEALPSMIAFSISSSLAASMSPVYLRVQSAPVFLKTRIGTFGTNRPSAA
ncbi:MAG: hypothetical protein E5W25_24445 [Mesorhizobium sp.]|nr:MAG: hypothetical protein E5W25_24445 [Mesorhizobium sp.]